MFEKEFSLNKMPLVSHNAPNLGDWISISLFD